MSHTMTRRHFVAGAGVAAAGVLLGACQPKVVEVTKEVPKEVTKVVEKLVTPVPSTAVPAKADVGPLRIMWNGQTALVKYFEQYSADVFGPKNNGAKVNIEVTPDAEFSQKLLAGVAAGNPPDIFREVNYLGFTHYCIEGVILALDDLIARDGFEKHLATFLPGALDAGKFKSKQYCIPFGGHPSSYFLFFNKTALGKKGIKLEDKKWTWSEYVQVAQTMADAPNKVYGSWVRLNTEGFLVGLRSLGSDLIDETGAKCLVGAEQSRPFFDMVYKLITEYKVTPTPTDVGDWKPPFAAGKIMMANDNGYRESFLRETVKEFEFDTFLTPNEGKKPRGCFVCDFSAITSFSKHRDLAWEWAKGILQVEEGIKRVKDARHIPLPTEAALLPKGETLSPQYEFYVKQWIAEPPLPFPNPANGRTTEVTSILENRFQAAWLKTEPLDTVIKKVQEEIQKVLDAKSAV
jgi:ABC-type glycerol-3-phosphate transport system substrate-binding protein